MKFCWCTIKVKNMEESVRFYQEIVGLNIANRFAAGPDKEICFMGDGETKVELVYETNNKPMNNIEGISMGFEVESVDKMIDNIKEKGFTVASGPVQPNPHTKFFFINDPNGWSIQFVENIK